MSFMQRSTRRSGRVAQSLPELLVSAFAVLPVGAWITNAEGEIVYANAAAQRIGDVMERPIAEAISNREVIIDREMQIRAPDGSKRTALVSLVPLPANDRKVSGSLIIGHDITDRKELEAHLRDMSEHDALTGASTRRHLDDFLNDEIDRSRRYDSLLCVLMLDLDHFKRINDMHGHRAGDLLLAGLAKCIRQELRGVDLLARYGGEEFVVAAPGITRQQASLLAERLRARVATARFDTLPEVTCSIGVVQADRKDDADTLIQRADALMYEAKRTGRNRVVVESESA